MNVDVVEGTVTRPLRRAVLRPNLTDADPIPGDGEPDAVHFAAIEDDEVLGAGYLSPETCPWQPDETGWRLRGMATVEEIRGRGIGAAVLAAAVNYIAENGGGVLWCHARERAVPFYLRAGLNVYGEPFIEIDIPHRNMWQLIART